MRRRAPVWILLVGAGLSCNTVFGLHDTHEDIDAAVVAIDAPHVDKCANAQCGSDVCDPNTGSCNPCFGSDVSGCPTDMKFCSPDDTCHGCVNHTDCSSLVCEDGGVCADGSAIAYVSGSDGSDTAPCTLEMPCATIEHAMSKHPSDGIVKVLATLHHGTTLDLATTGGSAYEIIGDTGIGLAAGSAAPALTINNGVAVSLRDLLVTDGAPGILLNMPTSTASSLTILHCVISNNRTLGLSFTDIGSVGATLAISRSVIADNPGGGASVSGPNAHYQIVSNVFSGNGSAGSTAGGLRISQSTLASNVVSFNTIAHNASPSQVPAGLACDGLGSNAYNIVALNTGTPQAGGATTPACPSSFTLVSPGDAGDMPPLGSGNFVADPMFRSTIDLRLGTTSPAIGAGGSNAPLGGLAALDLEGVRRLEPADLGAFVHGD